MARYIDADELELEYYGLSIHGTMAVKSVLPVFAELLKEQQTADVVDVVRCSECKYGKKATINDKGFKICPVSGMEITDNDYCSYGERRTDDD